MNIPVMCDIAI